jgi:hypothetical protein
MTIKFYYGSNVEDINMEQNNNQENSIYNNFLEKKPYIKEDESHDSESQELIESNQNQELFLEHTVESKEVDDNVIQDKNLGKKNNDKIKLKIFYIVSIISALLFLVFLYKKYKDNNQLKKIQLKNIKLDKTFKIINNLEEKINQFNYFDEIYKTLSKFITIETQYITVFQSENFQIQFLNNNGYCFKVNYKKVDEIIYKSSIEYKISDNNLKINKYILDKDNEIDIDKISLDDLKEIDQLISSDKELDLKIKKAIKTINELINEEALENNLYFKINLSLKKNTNQWTSALNDMFINNMMKSQYQKAQQFYDLYTQEFPKLITIENKTIPIFKSNQCKIGITKNQNCYCLSFFYKNNPKNEYQCIEFKIMNNAYFDIIYFNENRDPKEITQQKINEILKVILNIQSNEKTIQAIKNINELIINQLINKKILKDNIYYRINLLLEPDINQWINPLKDIFISNMIREQFDKAQEFYNLYETELPKVITIEEYLIQIFKSDEFEITIKKDSDFYFIVFEYKSLDKNKKCIEFKIMNNADLEILYFEQIHDKYENKEINQNIINEMIKKLCTYYKADSKIISSLTNINQLINKKTLKDNIYYRINLLLEPDINQWINPLKDMFINDIIKIQFDKAQFYHLYHIELPNVIRLDDPIDIYISDSSQIQIIRKEDCYFLFFYYDLNLAENKYKKCIQFEIRNNYNFEILYFEEIENDYNRQAINQQIIYGMVQAFSQEYRLDPKIISSLGRISQLINYKIVENNKFLINLLLEPDIKEWISPLKDLIINQWVQYKDLPEDNKQLKSDEKSQLEIVDEEEEEDQE